MSTTSNVLDAIRAKRDQINQRKASFVRSIKPEDGKHIYRILPSWRVDEHGARSGQFWHDFGMHYVRSKPNDKPSAYICLKDTFDRECDLCSAVYAAVGAATNDDEAKFYREMRSTRRFLVNVLHLTGPKEKQMTPQLMELPAKVFEAIIEMVEEYGDITNLGESGKNVIVTREGSGLSTRYTVMPAAKPFAIPKETQKTILGELINIDAVVNQEDAARKKAVLDKLAFAVGVVPSSAPALSAPRATRALEIAEDDDVPFDVSSAIEEASEEDMDDLLSKLG